MANTKVGGTKVKSTMIERYGSEAAYKVHMQLIAGIGGRKTGMKGFALNPELARTAGKKGGSISRRRKIAIIE